jgi:chromate reductase, NAD(P)H dehydrogenase (quinone)
LDGAPQVKKSAEPLAKAGSILFQLCRMTPKILVFPGSNRAGAYSGKVADAAARELARLECHVTRISLIDFPLPIMDEDLQRLEGIPENVMRLGRLISAHDGLLIASPEYNGSIPPLLKNAIDWVSRIARDGDKAMKPFAGKIAGLCSSSNGNFAGILALSHLRPVLIRLGILVVSEQCSVPNAETAFNSDGSLKDERAVANLAKVCKALADQAAIAADGRR